MFILEPQRTRYDVNFNVAGIPARVHPLFWLCTAILGQKLPTYLILTWIAVAFVSILVHEMGHALAARACGFRPHIVLYAMGGLAIYRPTYHSPYRQVGISLAGPGAGFVLAAITAVLVIATGHKTEIVGGYYVGWGSEFSNDQLRNLVYFLMQVNLIWGCVNLLPIFPLDGGKIAQELWSAQDPITGMRKTLVLSIVVSVIGAAIAWFSVEDKLLALFFTVFSITNYLNLRQISSGGFGGGYGDNYEGGSGGGFDDGYEDSRGGRGW